LTLYVPSKLVEEARRRGFDVESLVVDLLVRTLNLDPQVVSDIHLELSHRYLGEGRALVGKDPVQASEKLYKAAEEAVKALAIFYNLQDILSRVEGRGRWVASDLEKAVEAISEKLGGWFLQSWDNAWALHVWGFHEAKLDSKAVEIFQPVEAHLELSRRYFGEGRALVGKDPVQASEKLYKAAEEAVKALAIFYNLQDVLAGVEEKGRWAVSYLEKAVEAISERLGGWFLQSWDNAWALHVWGFHEAKLDSKAVEIRLPYVERIVLETERVIQRGRAS
jgi:hypothetical protein